MSSSKSVIADFKAFIGQNLFDNALELIRKIAMDHIKEGLHQKGAKILEEIEKEIDRLEKSDQILRLSAYLIHLKGHLRGYESGRFKECIAYLEKGLSLAQRINAIDLIVHFSNDLAFFYRSLGDFKKATDLLEKAITLANDLPDDKGQSMLAESHLMMGIIYLDTGRHYASKDCLIQSIKYNPQLEFSYGVQLGFAIIFSEQGRYQDALNHFCKANKVADNLQIVDGLFELLLFYLDYNKINLAKETLVKMEEKSKYADHPNIPRYLKLAQAIVLKQSSRLAEIGLAMKMFDEIIEDILNHHYTDFFFLANLAIIHYSELLLYELKLNQDSDVLEEISNQIQRLYEFGEEQTSYRILIQSLLLSAQLQTIRRDLNSAEKFFKQALDIVDNLGLVLMKSKIEQMKNNLYDEFESWREIIDRNPALFQQIEKSNLENYVEQVLTRIESYQ